jgi:hypothetical protein
MRPPDTVKRARIRAAIDAALESGELPTIRGVAKTTQCSRVLVSDVWHAEAARYPAGFNSAILEKGFERGRVAGMSQPQRDTEALIQKVAALESKLKAADEQHASFRLATLLEIDRLRTQAGITGARLLEHPANALVQRNAELEKEVAALRDRLLLAESRDPLSAPIQSPNRRFFGFVDADD